MKRVAAGLWGAAFAIGVAGTANAQDVTVRGQRMPSAEAPKSATCEALSRDPFFIAQLAAAGGDPMMGPRPYLPTRAPRNPDYNAPPKVPVGTPLPAWTNSRFGARDLRRDLNGGVDASTPLATADIDPLTGDAVTDPAVAGGDPLAASLAMGDRDAAILACRTTYRRGLDTSFTTGRADFQAGLINFEGRAAAAERRFAAGRAMIAARDRTLPTALMLFDQGRYVEALDWFRKASNKLPYEDGGDEAALFVGKIYLQGLGDKSDPQEALKWLKRAATAPYNNALHVPQFDPRQPDRNTAVGEAAVILANIYRKGFGGIAKDPEQSRRWFDRAWDVGHVAAGKMLGDLYFDGIDAPRDVDKAMGFYRKAAKLNHPGAQVALARILYDGAEGVRQDRKKALAWYEAAAKSGHRDGLYALARAYDFGDGVKPDPEKAIGFYKAAALGGSAPAQAALGTYFYEGRQVPKDDAIARRWFETAAKDAEPEGMVNLAAMLARGEGGEKDMAKAWAWLAVASKLGNRKAPQMLAAVERKMSPAERQAAATLAPR